MVLRPNVRAKLGPTVGRQARGSDNARLLQPGPGGLPLGLSLSDRLGLRARWLRARICGDNPAQVKGPGTKPIAPPHGCDPKSSALRTLLEAGWMKATAVNEAHGDDASGARACAAHGRDHQASKAFMFFARPNVRAKRAPTAGRAGQQAQNGPQAQRLMASVACRWRSA